MLIISWNVAGWSHTVHRITDAYSSSATISAQQQEEGSNSKLLPPPSSSCKTAALQYYLHRHQVDILCLQEHKIPLSQLSSRSEPRQCSTIDGYESFWSCCVSNEKNKRGFNGVVTYVKKSSVGVVKANGTNVLGIPELDAQGRCLMTDHGSFVIFNVYVPALGGQGLQVRMQFLRALQKAAQKQRTIHNKHVMIIGDLNIAHTKLDRYWKDRIVHVQDVLDQVQNEQNEQQKTSFTSSATIDNTPSSSSSLSLPQWKYDIARHWSTIVKVMKETKQVVPIQTTNPTTGEKFNKFRLSVMAPTTPTPTPTPTTTTTAAAAATKNDTSSDGGTPITATVKRVYLGKHENSPDHCTWEYEALDEPCTYVDPTTYETCIVREANTVSIQILQELMTKIVGIDWDKKQKNGIETGGSESSNSSSTAKGVSSSSSCCILRQIANDESVTGINRASPSTQWLTQIMEQDGMVDTLRHYYPTAEGRFTCWHQFTNRRYDNEGVRLDYILIDQALLSFLQKGHVKSLRCGIGSSGCTTTKGEEPHKLDPLSEDAAWAAATANGKFQPVSFHGGGIESVSRSILDTQFGDDQPHTGIIYTPPSFSDHVGVSALFDNSIVKCQSTDSKVACLDSKDPNTRKAQPHKAQRSIMSFLENNNSNTTTTTKNTKQISSEKEETKQQQQKHSFFRTIKDTSKTSTTRRKKEVLTRYQQNKQSIRASFFAQRQQSSTMDANKTHNKKEQQENPPTPSSSSAFSSTERTGTTVVQSKMTNTKKARTSRSTAITATRNKKKQKVLPRKGSILQHFSASTNSTTSTTPSSSPSTDDVSV